MNPVTHGVNETGKEVKGVVGKVQKDWEREKEREEEVGEKKGQV